MINIETMDGRVLNGAQLVNVVPNLGYLFSSQHADICSKLAKMLYPEDSEKYRIYVNLLFKQSSGAKAITALKVILENKIVDCKTVILPEALKGRIDFLEEKDLSIRYVNKEVKFLKSRASKFILKALVHNFYRIIGWRSKKKILKNKSIVRCFVEVSEHLHGKEMPYSLCLFFPFPYKFSRYYNFYKSCKKRNFFMGFYGIPYSLSRALKLIYRDSDEDFINFEYLAYSNYGKELARYNLKHYFTEDDYASGSFIVAKHLKQSGCCVVNRVHGLGNAGPYIDASIFEVISKQQMNFYQKWNQDINIYYDYQERQTKEIDSEEIFDDVCYIFMHGNYKDHGCSYEAKLQEGALIKLDNKAKNSDLDIRVKYHPNTKIKEKISLEEVTNVEAIKKHKVFITIYSTSFFTFSSQGMFVFVGDELCNPFEILSKKVPFFCVSNLENIFNVYPDVESVVSAKEKQDEMMRDFEV